jgi:competence protein ComEA
MKTGFTMLIRLVQVAALLGLLFTQVVYAAPDSVNVNTADAELIAEVLDGVGMRRAQAIVDYREDNGAFADAYDLANVKGIGDRTVELNEDKIRERD